MKELHSLNVKFDIAYFSEDFSQEEVSRIAKMQTDRQMLGSNGDDVLNGCIDSLRAEKNKKKSENSLDSLEALLKKKK
jgi:activator of HSP90 ATPase